MAKARKKATKSVSIKRGSCRVVSGAVRVCVSPSGKLTTSISPLKRRKSSSGKKASTSRKPAYCKTVPRKKNGRCSCKTKPGANRYVKAHFCK